jgi:hypothetical protein
MQLRIARHTERLEEVVAFYRDGIGCRSLATSAITPAMTAYAVTRRVGVQPVAAANPYWAEHGVTIEDPDGFRVVLVPEPWNG